MSGLGLTYRNSKWSGYNRSNISPTSLINFKILVKFATSALVLILLVVSFNKYFMIFNVTYKSTSLLWFISDTSLYTKSLLLSLSLLYIQVMLESVLSHFIPSWSGSLSSNNTTLSKSTDLNNLSKSDYSQILHNWLLSNQTKLSKDILKQVYSQESRHFTTLRIFYKSLFELTAELSLPKQNINQLSTLVSNLTLKSQNTIGLDKLSGITKPVYTSLILSHNTKLRSGILPANKLNTTFLNSLYDWNLSNVETSLDSSIGKKFVKGNFYTNIDNFSEINTLSHNFNELKGLSSNLQEQTMWVKEQRWLYKYSLLHNKNNFNLHKNTLTKRLINSGFYDSKLDQRNIQVQSLKEFNPQWASLMGNLFKSNYPSFIQTQSTQTLENNTAGLQNFKSSKNLSFYEQSQFWYLIRTYNFMTLGSNQRVSAVALKSTKKPSYSPLTTDSSLNYKLSLKVLNELSDVRKGSFEGTRLTQIATDNSKLSNSTLLVLDSYDLFNYDFTALAAYLTLNDYHSSTGYNYYSFSNFSSRSDFQNGFNIKGLK